MSSHTKEELKSWNTTQLKDELRKRKLPVSGNKTKLIDRLLEKSAEDVPATESTEESKESKTIGKKRSHDEVETNEEEEEPGKPAAKKRKEVIPNDEGEPEKEKNDDDWVSDDERRKAEDKPKKKEKEKETKEETGETETKKEKNSDDSDMLKIVCFNINGVRSAAKKGLEKYLETENGQIVCFSEMKADESANPCEFNGYQVIWNECKKKRLCWKLCIDKNKAFEYHKRDWLRR